MKAKRKTKWNFENINWDEFMSKYFLSIYNLDKKPCLINSCKRNCSDNLYCINRLGELKWNEKTCDNDEKNNLKTETNFAAGLKNYGNTCYFNSLLQVYFNIVELKEAIFQFPGVDEIITYLQTIFAQMQLSIHKTVDPVELINALELPQLEQQDAPEFHSLFMNLLDQRFALIGNDVIKSLLSGTIRYLTRCKGCGYESQIDCQFREIDLKPMLSFDQAIMDFLKVELLTDDNRYDCSLCHNKCDGERQAVLQKLPPLLCFQFLRYSYDNAGTKKKNCSNAGFSSYLSMDNYLPASANPADRKNGYVIKAILIHIGMQPSSGHYQTLIHTSNQEWILYDDLNVQKLESIDEVKKILGQKKTTVNKSESPSIRKNSKEFNYSVNFLSSNAYMVFYEREDVFNKHSNNTNSVEVPLHLKGNIQLTNESYLSELETKRKEQLESDEKFLKESQTINEAFGKLMLTQPVDEQSARTDNFEFLPTAWITKWLLDGFSTVMTPSHDYNNNADLEEWKSLLCRHEMLGPDVQLSQIKIVNSRGVDFLITQNFISSNYKRRYFTTLCDRCWRLKFEIKKFENISKTDPEIDNCLKVQITPNSTTQRSYWISKSHLRHWRKIIRQAIENKFSDSLELQEDYNSGGSSFKELPNILNSDLLCSHNNLSIDSSKRILISEKVWKKILSYFPNRSNESEETQYLEFYYNPNSTDGCMECSSQLLDVIKKSEIEKTELNKIFNFSRKRFEFNGSDKKISCLCSSPSDSDLIGDEVQLFLIPTSFILEWKRFIKNPSVDTIVTDIDYSDIFCQHGKFLSKDWFHFVEEDSLYFLWQSEWDKFITYYPEIEFEKVILKVDNKFSEPPELLSSVTVCQICYDEWNALQSKFENSIIYIRLVPTNDGSIDGSFETAPKRKIKSKVTVEKNIATPKEIDPSSIRRSARSKRHRNDTIVRINSDDTIKDLKLKLMNIYNVSPIDQHLVFNEQELADVNCIIREAGIRPSSILYLILDTELITTVETTNGSVETGFSGTKLMQSLRQ